MTNQSQISAMPEIDATVSQALLNDLMNLKQTVVTAPRVSKAKSRRCNCGKCAPCIDNARWERIFNEKFADPSYYTRDRFRCSSPLN